MMILHSFNVFFISFSFLCEPCFYNSSLEYERQYLITVYVIIFEHNTLGIFAIDHQFFVKDQRATWLLSCLIIC